ncbi:MAG: shikimate dehydrogenase family protein [candidate division WOR-3 bacterium]
MARYALLGSPVSHSLSPTLMARLGLDYHAREMGASGLRSFMNTQANHYSGLNITTPLKEAIIPFMDGVSSDAREINGVNCAVRRADSWEGHNTDWAGILFAMDHIGLRPDRALIVGTGPGARAAAFALQSKGVRFLFLSRRAGPGRITRENLAPGILEDHQLIINAAPPGTSLLPPEFLMQHNFVLDMNYGERAGALRVSLAGSPAAYSDGLLILIGQAAASLVLWLGGEFGEWADRLISAARDIGIL